MTLFTLKLNIYRIYRKGIVIGFSFLFFALSACETPLVANDGCQNQPALSSRQLALIEEQGCQFRDLNSNGRLDVYEDWRQTPVARAEHLLSLMTVPEKAGQLMHGTAYNNAPYGSPATGYNQGQVTAAISHYKITHFVSGLSLPTRELAEANNQLQEISESGRLGIPVVISSDPRHHFQEVAGASVSSGSFTKFPETLGLAAIGDAEVVRHFADIARQEYRAVGFSMALSPQADLATEPRWSRINGTFGEDAALVASLVGGYVEGFQKGRVGLSRESVASVVKHWVGYGAAKEGWDSHNYYGRFADLSSEQLPNHIKPFKAAFANNVAGVMPAYSIFSGLKINDESDSVLAGAYNKPMMSLLRNGHNFDGVVVSDWAITKDCAELCKQGFPKGKRPTFEGVSTAWGVEDLTREERFALALNNGVDQFGGELDSGPLLNAFKQGLITEARIDQSVLRVLKQTFSLGLFERPFVDADTAVQVVGQDAFKSFALEVQSQAVVALENGKGILPLRVSVTPKIYLQGGFKESVFIAAGFTVVNSPKQADIAILKTSAPYETLHPNFFFGSIQHEGSLAFSEDDEVLVAAREISKKIPVILSAYLDRPAILTPFKSAVTAMLVNFGVSDQALLDVLTGKVKPVGKLPFELPSSMAAVEAQHSGAASDSRDPLYPIHHRVVF